MAQFFTKNRGLTMNYNFDVPSVHSGLIQELGNDVYLNEDGSTFDFLQARSSSSAGMERVHKLFYNKVFSDYNYLYYLKDRIDARLAEHHARNIFSYTNNVPVRLPAVFVITGAGGTASWFLPKLIKMLDDHEDKNTSQPILIILVDGDIIETKNLVRQNFILPDVGQNKAKVLADRYAPTIRNKSVIKLNYIDKYFYVGAERKAQLKADLSEEEFGEWVDLQDVLNRTRANLSDFMFINLIDNGKTRKDIHEYAQRSSINCIDVGNELYNGQLTFSGYGLSLSINRSWLMGKVCLNSLIASGYYFNQLTDQLDLDDDVSLHSCADHDTENVEQMLGINDLAATVLGNYLNSLFESNSVSCLRVDFVTGNNMSVTSKLKIAGRHEFSIMDEVFLSEYLSLLPEDQDVINLKRFADSEDGGLSGYFCKLYQRLSAFTDKRGADYTRLVFGRKDYEHLPSAGGKVITMGGKELVLVDGEYKFLDANVDGNEDEVDASAVHRSESVNVPISPEYTVNSEEVNRGSSVNSSRAASWYLHGSIFDPSAHDNLIAVSTGLSRASNPSSDEPLAEGDTTSQIDNPSPVPGIRSDTLEDLAIPDVSDPVGPVVAQDNVSTIEANAALWSRGEIATNMLAASIADLPLPGPDPQTHVWVNDSDDREDWAQGPSEQAYPVLAVDPNSNPRVGTNSVLISSSSINGPGFDNRSVDAVESLGNLTPT